MWLKYVWFCFCFCVWWNTSLKLKSINANHAKNVRSSPSFWKKEEAMYANSGLLLKTMTEKLLLLFLYVHAPPLSALYCFFWLLYTVSSLTMLKLWCHSHNNRYALGRFESWLVICQRVFPQHREALIYFMLIYYSTWSHWMHSEWNHMASVFNILWIVIFGGFFLVS